MRLFIAIEIVPEIRERLTQYIERIKPQLGRARWARPEGMHITLKFLGNVADTKRSAIEDELRNVRGSQLSIAIENVGAFPTAKSPRVLWAGIQAGPQLEQLAKQTEKAMGRLGFEPENRAFTPHVTLARFDPGGRKADLVPLLAEPKPSFGTMTATEFHLYESKLSPGGSRYVKLASFALD
jgi:2'-5' RNA ligase